MSIKNTFSFSGRWDSAGIDCSFCKYFVAPSKWPDVTNISACFLHKISLKCKLNQMGFIEGETVCKNFSDNGTAFSVGVEEFDRIKGSMENAILYSIVIGEEELTETSFTDLY